MRRQCRSRVLEVLKSERVLGLVHSKSAVREVLVPARSKAAVQGVLAVLAWLGRSRWPKPGWVDTWA